MAIISQEGEVIEESFEIQHTVDGMNILFEKMEKLPKENIKILMEHTGNYNLPVLISLQEKGYYVSAENPLKLKKCFDCNLRKVKTDKKDALKLADYASKNWYELKESIQDQEVYEELRFLSREYQVKVDMKIKQKIALSNICDVVFPGFYSLLINEKFANIGLLILKKYYHPELVLKKKKEKFINEINLMAQKIGHKSLGKTIAIKVYAIAEQTISSRPNNKNTQLAVTSCIDALLLVNKALDDIISQLTEYAKDLPEYEEMIKVPGIGPVLCSRLIAEIGDIKRFKNAGSLIAYAGVDTPPYQSGKYQANNVHISKRGNKYLRKVGYEIMLSIKASRPTNSELYQYIIKKENEGKPKKVAKIAGFNKLLRIYYGKFK